MGKKQKDKAVTGPCEKYGLAITDYVLGEQMDITPEELFNHLRACTSCLDDLLEWKDTYAAMRTEAYHAKPETQEKMKRMVENLKQQVFGTPSVYAQAKGETVLNTDWEIGNVAGDIYRYVGKKGKTDTIEISRNTKLPLVKIDRALGWLAREKKVCLSEANRLTYVYLPKPAGPQAQV